MVTVLRILYISFVQVQSQSCIYVEFLLEKNSGRTCSAGLRFLRP